MHLIVFKNVKTLVKIKDKTNGFKIKVRVV